LNPETEKPKVLLPAVIKPKPVAALDDALAWMNSRHAIIENVGGKSVIAGWEPSSVDPDRLVVVYQGKESFLLRYSNQSVQVTLFGSNGIRQTTRVSMGPWWLAHEGRRTYRGIVFVPGGPPVIGDMLNLWQGWGVNPKEGDWSLIRRHIVEVVTGRNEECAEYIIRWIAWAIQNPGKQAEVALVLIGPKGTGKGTLVRCLERIFGAHAFQVTCREHVIDKFNGHLQETVLFVADEAYWGGDKRCVGRLQGMITEPTLAIERKGFDVVQMPNRLHIVMLAEPGWVIPAGRYERRYAALEVSAVHMQEKAYFGPLHRQIDGDGAAAMFHELQRMELGDWHPREIPEVLLKGKALTATCDILSFRYCLTSSSSVISSAVGAAKKSRLPCTGLTPTVHSSLSSQSTGPYFSTQASRHSFNGGNVQPLAAFVRYFSHLIPILSTSVRKS
jgi:Family of unknown function (DUF5906)